MLCEECRKRQATVHISQVMNGDKTEKNLCEQCAKSLGGLDLMGMVSGSFDINNMVAAIMNMEQAGATPKTRAASCPTCGMDYRRFAETGRLGCADCYHTFSRQLAPLLKRIHGNPVHQGKLPHRGARAVSQQRAVGRLKSELKSAVEQEQFERAAELRDHIKKLEQEQGM